MLKVEALSAGFGGRPLARLSELRVSAGHTALLLGRSGSGKTTLLLAMAGLAQTFSGLVWIDDTEVLALKLAARDRFRGRHIGLVFQDLHLIPGVSALDNVLMAPFAAGIPQDRKRALDLLDELGLADAANQSSETLSRGQAQRCAIARAMLIRPKLILVDEPTASLDDDACRLAFDLLSRAAKETGAALVIATHDQRLKALADATVQVEPVAMTPARA